MQNILKCIILIVIILFVSSQKHVKIKEGYESLTTCVEQGYSKDFCLNVPIQANLDTRCRCATGEFGNYKSPSTCDCKPFNLVNDGYNQS